MATILFTYEFGAGLGHLNRLLAVAARLRDHRLVFALPDLALGRAVVERALGPDAEIHQGLAWPAPTDPQARKIPTQTFADVIRLFGFHDVARLEHGVRLWLGLMDDIRPDLIVSDFAPTLRLASQGRIPTIVVGNGYTVPPTGCLLPPMRPWETGVPARSRAHEGELVAAVNEVRSRQAGPPIDFFADLFQGEASFVCTLAEFDPYGRSRQTAPLWPFNVPVIPNPTEGMERDRIFAYFQAGHPALHAVLDALGQLGRKAEIYVQGVDARALAARCARHIGIHTKPADFASVLPRASLILHHAGLGTAYAGLVAGLPQVVLPLNLEHAITTAGLEAFGSALRVKAAPAPDPAQLSESLALVLEGSAQTKAAAVAARDLSDRRDPESVGRIVGACRALLP